MATENIGWFLTSTSNIKTYLDQSWQGTLGPLWSLAVEEQFYFIWPAFILLIKKKYLKKILIICICLGPVFRLVSILVADYMFGNINLRITSSVLVTSNFDLFAIGGLLAYCVFYSKDFSSNFHKLVFTCNTVLFIVINIYYDSIFYHLFFNTVIAVWSFYVIKFLLIEKTNPYSSVFQFRPFVYLGKVSYGIYLFHGLFFFIFAILSFAEIKLLGINLFFNNYLGQSDFTLFKNLANLILVCSLLWFLFEKPINQLKRFFVN